MVIPKIDIGASSRLEVSSVWRIAWLNFWIYSFLASDSFFQKYENILKIRWKIWKNPKICLKRRKGNKLGKSGPGKSGFGESRSGKSGLYCMSTYVLSKIDEALVSQIVLELSVASKPSSTFYRDGDHPCKSMQ